MTKDDKKKIYLEANIELKEETAAMRKAAASIIKLPKDGEKQPDLQYFSAVFVSSGENLNHAFFMPSELVQAEGTITNKALDVEHKESEIIGHIYDRVFVDAKGNMLELDELSSLETANLDTQAMHVVIAGIIYKNRFPNLAKEVEKGKWKVSMECYYRDFDVKVGDLIITRNEAEALGFASEDDNAYSVLSRVVKNGLEIAKGKAARVLRGICFSGCGVVENPANPPSVILETAQEIKKGETVVDKEIVLDYDKLENNNVTSLKVEDLDSETSETKEISELKMGDTVGICVSFKKQVIDSTFKDERSKVLHENWCALYEKSCTSFSRDTTDPKCLKNQINKTAKACVEKLLKEREASDRRDELVDHLEAALEKAAKISYEGE